jgi:hypothetical protein
MNMFIHELLLLSSIAWVPSFLPLENGKLDLISQFTISRRSRQSHDQARMTHSHYKVQMLDSKLPLKVLLARSFNLTSNEYYLFQEQCEQLGCRNIFSRCASCASQQGIIPGLKCAEISWFIHAKRLLDYRFNHWPSERSRFKHWITPYSCWCISSHSTLKRAKARQ